MKLSDLEARRQQLEQDLHACAAKHHYHASETAKYDRELAIIQGRLDENAFYRSQAAETSAATAKPGAEKKTRRPSSRQRFQSHGPTAVVVRLLYEERAGLSTFEIQARLGSAIRNRMLKKIVGRLIEGSYARQEGNKVLLTDKGIRTWEDSPLYLHTRREGQARAGQRTHQGA